MTVCVFCGVDPCELEQERAELNQALVWPLYPERCDTSRRASYLERCRSVIRRLERLHEQEAA